MSDFFWGYKKNGKRMHLAGKKKLFPRLRMEDLVLDIFH